MADQTNKALDLGSELVSGADLIIKGIEKVKAAKDKKESSGIDFTSQEVEDALENSAIKHVDGAVLNSVISVVDQLDTWMRAGFLDDPLQQARS